MRVLMPNATIMEIESVFAVSEQRFAFNGREVRLCECAKDISFANGLVFWHESSSMATESTTLIGNLSNEFVKGVLASLARQGYTDLSGGLKLQKTQPMVTDYVFDGGVSGAYMIQGFDARMCCGANPMYPFMGGAMPNVSKAEDVEDEEDAGEEDCDNG